MASWTASEDVFWGTVVIVAPLIENGGTKKKFPRPISFRLSPAAFGNSRTLPRVRECFRSLIGNLGRFSTVVPLKDRL
jgi:hypothetical protein